MKKSMVVLMSLFILASCSEDSYEAKGDSTPNPGFENTVKNQPGLGSNGYSSPYDGSLGVQSPYYLKFEFDIQAPIDRIEITPHVGPIYKRQQLDMVARPKAGCDLPGATPCNYCMVYPTALTHLPNILKYSPHVNAVETNSPFSLSGGNTFIQDCNAAIPIFPGSGCPNVPFIFDYGLPGSLSNATMGVGETTILSENSKIYLIEYRFSLGGQSYSGMLRHQLGDDTMRLSDYTSQQWSYFTDFPKLNTSPYDKVVVISSDLTGELALAQHDSASTPLNSEVTVTDPNSGIDYTLRFRNESNRILIELVP